MAPIKTICVYCGSGFGANPSFVDAAAELGQLMAEFGASTSSMAAAMSA